MATKCLGIVNANGDKQYQVGGVDFTSQPIDDGQAGSYQIAFDPAFSQTPVLLVSLDNAAQNMTARTTPGADGFQIYVTQDLGNGPVPAACGFSFGAWSD